MNIGQAAEASGVTAKMIRYYESIGLIEAPARTEAGYRVYGSHDIYALRFIKRARTLGFSIEETAGLLALWRDKSRASADVKAFALQHVHNLEAKIGELQAMTRTLRHLASHCHGDARPNCPILDDLATLEPDKAQKDNKGEAGRVRKPQAVGQDGHEPSKRRRTSPRQPTA
ncbi:Cu(I)-responsive transcriptional regulator [Microvirga sp. VF16]|uniref:Cu(I)-responsive transcriptional regulator n=1 Tax=Microvirga sp. VF16 TaxID=2807101 RepID=UPI00193C9208|nr:Cu(I)-responsive transcriptional regulator [Microvirga sp. VF16]QRM34641.1 Cu(I)-responsive transcriptional regulator [Microvirga sp. VF16]